MGGAGEPEKAPQEPKPSIPGENIVGDTQLTRVSGVPVTTLSSWAGRVKISKILALPVF